MLTENQNFYQTRLDVGSVLSDEITCLQRLKLEGPIHNLQVYVSSIAMYGSDSDEALNNVA
jgi:hypothetical protein